MCGRFAQFSPVSLLKVAFEIRAEKCGEPVQSYNVAPSQAVLAIIHSDERVLTKLFWGISPRMFKQGAKPPLLINARFETIGEKPAFRDAYSLRRCLIPADGFYEWEKTGTKKQPWFFSGQSGQPLAFAGIWETSKETGISIRNTCAIITTEAMAPVSEIHSRMPVILDRKAHDTWLNPDENNPARLKEIVQEGRITGLNGHPVSRKVNSVSNNDPSCIAPVDTETNHKQH